MDLNQGMQHYEERECYQPWVTSASSDWKSCKTSCGTATLSQFRWAWFAPSILLFTRSTEHLGPVCSGLRKERVSRKGGSRDSAPSWLRDSAIKLFFQSLNYTFRFKFVADALGKDKMQ